MGDLVEVGSAKSKIIWKVANLHLVLQLLHVLWLEESLGLGEARAQLPIRFIRPQH